MLDLRMEDTIDNIIENLNDIERTHLKFAMSKALTLTAHEGRKEVISELPDRFHIRTGWTARGIRATGANKRDRDPSASVSTIDWYMETQEAGGSRKPRSGHFWVPTLAARAGSAISGRVLSRYYPKHVMNSISKASGMYGPRLRKSPRGAKNPDPRRPKNYAKPKAFIAGNNVYIRQDEYRLPIVRLYALTDHATLPPRWQFEKTMQRVSGKQLRLQFIRALDGALKTARGGRVKSAYVDYLMEHGGTGAPSIQAGLMRAEDEPMSMRDILARNGML